MSSEPFRFDAFLPPEMAAKAEAVGVRKAGMDTATMFALSVLAGAFIACGAIFATTVFAGDATGIMTYGVQRLLGGLVFCLGLILVVVADAELFTGNNLIVMAWVNGRVSLSKLLRNWVIVYTGNLIGALATVVLMFMTHQYAFGGGAIGRTALNIANAKVSLGFWQAIALGIMCNALVCLAVWLTFSARSTTDKILAIIFPITAFVAAGFEHSIANMYFIPIGLLIKTDVAFLTMIERSVFDYAGLTWWTFVIRNLVPVTIGNIIGGAGLVGLVYWFCYLRSSHVPSPRPMEGRAPTGQPTPGTR